MTAILEQLQGLVAAAEIPAGTLGVALILGLFGLMVVGLVLGQELAFVLGGAVAAPFSRSASFPPASAL